MAARLGVPAQSIAQGRVESLTEGEHWTSEGGVKFTEAGEARLREVLGLEAKGAVEPEKVAEVTLRVISKMPNKTYVRVRTPQNTAWVLRVRNSRKLRAGTMLRCAPDGAGWKCVHPGHAPVR